MFGAGQFGSTPFGSLPLIPKGAPEEAHAWQPSTFVLHFGNRVALVGSQTATVAGLAASCRALPLASSASVVALTAPKPTLSYSAQAVPVRLTATATPLEAGS